MSAPTALRIHEDGVDVNRGATIRNGVCMHKDDPGIYFTKNGYEVSEKDAKAQGFPVDRNRQQRAKNIKTKKAMREIEVEFGQRQAAIESEYVDPTAGKMLDSELVIARSTKGSYPMETASYLMKHMGGPRWTVEDKRDDHKRMFEPTSREKAIDWMLTHAEADEKAEAEERAEE